MEPLTSPPQCAPALDRLPPWACQGQPGRTPAGVPDHVDDVPHAQSRHVDRFPTGRPKHCRGERVETLRCGIGETCLDLGWCWSAGGLVLLAAVCTRHWNPLPSF